MAETSSQSECVMAPLLMRLSFARMVQKPRISAPRGIQHHLASMRLFTSVRHKNAKSSGIFHYVSFTYLYCSHVFKYAKPQFASRMSTDDAVKQLRFQVLTAPFWHVPCGPRRYDRRFRRDRCSSETSVEDLPDCTRQLPRRQPSTYSSS